MNLGGGTGLWIRNDLDFDIINVTSIDKICEMQAISLNKQCVDIDGTQSDWLDVQLGVPQGSILGPILFLIYVNDICLLYTSPSPRD